MTEPDQDPRVLQAYRDLGGETPPPALDVAILAVARRRGGRWHVPVAAAAALALAVGVALIVQREEPKTSDTVALAPQVIPAPAGRRERAAEVRELEKAAPAAAPAAPAAARPAPLAESAVHADRAAAPMAARSAQAPEEARAADVAGASVSAGLAGKAESPEAWLKRIAALRAAGRHEEADERLAEFRRRYPDYEIPEAMRARVLRR